MKYSRLLAGALIAVALSAGAANASVNFSDNFDADTTPGVSKLNYNNFINWTVTGQVDLVATPNGFGITGSGAYVDLDGSSGPGALTSKQTFAFNAGDLVTFSFDYSGSQRSSASDQLSYGFLFTGAGTAANLKVNNVSYGNTTYGLLAPSFNFTSVPGNQGWSTMTYSFTAQNAGSAKLYFGTNSADNIGPIIDNVKLTATGAVPEPTTWALMIMGFGLAGGALRRQRVLAA